ncbi:MAG: metal-dependent hydrolase [Ramlibacter sp.]
MDNLTHTLAGVLIGETVSRFAPAAPSGLAPRQRRGLLVVLSAVCSNLPDADVAYTTAAGTKLAYLSQHRGYTHTIVGVLLAAALVILAVELFMHWRRLQPTRGDRQAIVAAVVISLVIHLALDFTNSYGVHPFWPVRNHWVYGDAVFIIEPLLWTCAAPLLFLLRTLLARLLLAVVLVAALGLSFGTQWIIPASGVALAVLMGALLYAGWKAPPRAALACATGAWLAVTAAFFFGSDSAARRVAMPSNPLCWNVIAITLEADRYVMRRAALATAPQLLAVRDCPDRTLDAPTSAPMRRLAGPGSAAVRWIDEYQVSRAGFPRVLQAYCEAAILMRFARAPWIASSNGRWVMGDLRYDREPELGFAEMELTQRSGACASATPPWIEPRRDVMAPGP